MLDAWLGHVEAHPDDARLLFTPITGDPELAVRLVGSVLPRGDPVRAARPKRTLDSARSPHEGDNRSVDAGAPAAILALQQSAGNQAVAAFLTKPTLQRKVRSIGSGQVYTDRTAAGDAKWKSAAALDPLLTSPDLYTVQSDVDLNRLADGHDAQVLTPHRHVIGERHTESKFNNIAAAWPGVPTMGEGDYTVAESDLRTGTKGRADFERVMLSKDSDRLPLDNFHAAAFARLSKLLVMFNTRAQWSSAGDVGDFVRESLRDVRNVVRTYHNVGNAVYLKHSGLFGQKYKRDIEKAYGNMAELFTKSTGKKGMKAIETLAEADDPKPSQEQFDAARELIDRMAQIIGEILRVSTEGSAAGAAVKEQTGDVVAGIGELAQKGGDEMGKELGRVNPLRELFMAEQLKTLAIPGLVKVGSEHLKGLDKLRLADAILYDDHTAFSSGLWKDLKKLTAGKGEPVKH